VVATKCDKLPASQVLNTLSQLNLAYDLPTGYPIPISSATGYGKRDLWKVIRSAILGELFVEDTSEEPVDSNEPQEEDPLVTIMQS
jgi:hypothetical protein